MNYLSVGAHIGTISLYSYIPEERLSNNYSVCVCVCVWVCFSFLVALEGQQMLAKFTNQT